MIDLTEMVVVTAGVFLAAGFVRRFSPTARRARLSRRALQHWHAHELELAISDYESLEREANRIKNDAQQERVHYVAWQALGFIHRGLGHHERAMGYLDDAVALLDQTMEQPPEWALLTRIEQALCQSAITGRNEFPRQRFDALLDALNENQKFTTIDQGLEYLQGLAGDAKVTPCALEIVCFFEERIVKLRSMDSRSTLVQKHVPQASAAKLQPGDKAGASELQSAFAAPGDSEQQVCRFSTLWVNAKIARATLASYIAEHGSTAIALQQIQSDPIWWMLDKQTISQVNQLFATYELTCGSVKRAVELRRSELESMLNDKEDVNRIAATRLDYSSCLQVYGNEQLAYEEATKAYQLVRKQFRHRTPGKVSPWYPAVLALAIMEIGEFKRAHPLILEAMNGTFDQSGSFCQAYIHIVHSIYCRELGRLQPALEAAREAVGLIEKQFGDHAHQSGDYQLTVAATLLRMNKREQAAEVFENAKLNIEKKVTRNASTNSNLDMVHAGLDIAFGRYDSALRRLDALRKRLQPVILSDHTSFVAIENLSGDVARLTGNVEAAILHYEKGLEIGSAWKAPNSPELGRAMDHLVDGYQMLQDTKMSEAYRKKSDAIRAYCSECP